MKRLLAAALIVFGITVFAQQPTTPSTTPPTFSQPDKDAGRQMPPDTRATAPSTAEVQQQIQEKVNTEPGLAATKVKVKVTKETVTLKGKVADDAQREAVRRIAESYAGPRKIVDSVQVKDREK